MKFAYATFACAVALAACGSGENSGAGGSTGSGGSSTDAGRGGASAGASAGTAGGATSSAGTGTGSGGGGQSNAGGNVSTGGHSNTAGAAGGSKVDPGNPCVKDCPSGTVNACWGDGCPFGECDDSGFLAGPACKGVYTAPVNSSSVFCSAQETAGYCLLTVTNDLAYWAVNCVNGTPQVTVCPDSCGLDASGAAGC